MGDLGAFTPRTRFIITRCKIEVCCDTIKYYNLGSCTLCKRRPTFLLILHLDPNAPRVRHSTLQYEGYRKSESRKSEAFIIWEIILAGGRACGRPRRYSGPRHGVGARRPRRPVLGAYAGRTHAGRTHAGGTGVPGARHRAAARGASPKLRKAPCYICGAW